MTPFFPRKKPAYTGVQLVSASRSEVQRSRRVEASTRSTRRYHRAKDLDAKLDQLLGAVDSDFPQGDEP